MGQGLCSFGMLNLGVIVFSTLPIVCTLVVKETHKLEGIVTIHGDVWFKSLNQLGVSIVAQIP